MKPPSFLAFAWTFLLVAFWATPARPIEIAFTASGAVSGGGSSDEGTVSFGGLGFVRATIDYDKQTGKGDGPLRATAGGSYTYFDRTDGMTYNGGWSVNNQPGRATSPTTFGLGELIAEDFSVSTSVGVFSGSAAASFDFLAKRATAAGSGVFGGIRVGYGWGADLVLPDLLEPITRGSLYPSTSGGQINIEFRPNFNLTVAEMLQYTEADEVNFISWIVDSDVRRGVFRDRGSPPKDLVDLLAAGPVEDPPAGGWDYAAQDGKPGYYDASELPTVSREKGVVFVDAPNLGAGNGTFVRFRTSLLVRRGGADLVMGDVVEWEWREGVVTAPGAATGLKLALPGAEPAGGASVLDVFPVNFLADADRAFLQGLGVGLVVTPTPGDYNADGRVNAADYVVWRDTYGDTGVQLAADADGSFVVDDADYAAWSNAFGGATFSHGVAAAPEPTTAALVLVGWLAAARGRRRQPPRLATHVATTRISS